ncbi:hypothetical protein ACFFGH_18575 [Lysobacter korlensis]|uniref:Uncharacterized protein n=1 Tax=Lysobacter korlensis TaxID=553636 RepID=A0ABV6RS88_9GAMM
MKKPKNNDTKSPVLNKAVNQGRINTQTKKGGLLVHDDNFSDQSEGAKSEGQPTAMHGQGAGFSRNVH